MQNLYSPVRIRSSPPLVLSALLALWACSDPRDPFTPTVPTGLPRWSTAPYVQWVGPDEPVNKPMALFVAPAGGSLDQLAADSDVATFLNDKFTAMFVIPDAAPDLAQGMWFFDQNGCLLSGPGQPKTRDEWIIQANGALVASTQGQHLGPLSPSPKQWGFSVPESHPIRGACKVNKQAAG